MFHLGFEWLRVGFSGGVHLYFGIQFPFNWRWGPREIEVEEEWGIWYPCSLQWATRSPFFVIFPWKGIWRVKAPRWVSFFVWAVAWGKILMGDNLRSRGFCFCWLMCHVSLLWGDCGSLTASLWEGSLVLGGVLSLDLLGFCGSYQEQYQIFFLVGGIGWGSTR